MEFKVLGALRVVVDGEAVDVGSRLQRILLLALLASPGEPRSTDRLIDDLWGEAAPSDPVASIHSYVSNLRRLLEPGRRRGSPSRYIVRADGGYAIDLGSAELDAATFEADLEAIRTGALRPAEVIAIADRGLSRWRGDPFADAASRPFAAAPVASLLTLRAEMEQRRVAARLAREDVAGALAEAERLAIRYPLDESCHALLMTALYRSGRQSDALRVYSSIRHRLVTELGVEPGTPLRTLEHRILHHDVALEPATTRFEGSVGSSRLRSSEVPLVGRSFELGELLRMVDRARAARSPSVVLITGEAGIGKTRLVEEVADRLSSAGELIVWVQCERGAQSAGLLPLGSALRSALDSPLAASLRATPAGADAVELTDRLLHHGEPSPRLFDGSDDERRYQQLDGCRRILCDLGELVPVVVIVEDLHWAGEPLLDAVSFLVSRRDRGEVTTILTARTESSVADGEARAMSGLGSIDSQRLALGGLDRRAVEELASATLGAASQLIGEELWGRTGGNPFFVNELVRVLDPDDPVGSLASPHTPASIGDTVLARFDDLPDETIELLTAASLTTTWFDPCVCARAASVSTPAVDLIDRAIGAGLVIEHPTIVGRCSFRHDLVRSAIASRPTKVRRARIHAELGTALLDVHGFDDTETIADVAYHLSRGAPAGSGLVAAEAGCRASAVALDHHDAVAAVSIAREALDGLTYVAADQRDHALEAELWRHLALAHKRIGEARTAQDAARTAVAKARLSTDPMAIARAAICFNGGPIVSPWTGYWSAPIEAVDVLDEAYDALDEIDKVDEAGFRLLCALGEATCDAGDYRRADLASSQALDLATAEGRTSWLPEALLRRHRVVDVTGGSDDRRALIERAIECSTSSPPYRAMGLRAQIVADLERCDLHAAERGVARLRALAGEARSELLALDADLVAVAVDLLLGHLQRADDALAEIMTAYDHLDSGRLSMVELQMARLLYERHAGDTIEDRLRARLEDYSAPPWRAPLALLLSEHDRADEARAMMEPIAQEDFGRIHGSLLQFMTPCHLAEAVANVGDRMRAEWLLEPLTPLTDRLISFNSGQMFSGWVGLPVGRLLGVVGRFDEAEARLGEARRKARRLGSSIFEQRSDVALLELDHRAGRRPRSSAAAAHERAIGDGFLGIAHQAERLI